MTIMNEHAHSKRCLSAALISAVENRRDNQELTDHEFIVVAQDNELYHEAQAYLSTGLQTCTCGAKMFNDLWHEARNLERTDEDTVNEFCDRVRRDLPFKVDTEYSTWSPKYTSSELFRQAYDMWGEDN